MKGKLKNLVFVSGPHASGKSTLISKLIERIPHAISPQLRTKTPQFYWGGDENVVDIDFFHRQALKYAQRAIENYEYLIAARREQDGLVIGDRCIYDVHAYREVGITLGWLTREQASKLEENLRILNKPELLEPYCIILNPGFEVCKEHLKKRWRDTDWIKFMETDLKYLEVVCESFKGFEGRENFFYIRGELDYSKDEVLDELVEWIRGWYQK